MTVVGSNPTGPIMNELEVSIKLFLCSLIVYEEITPAQADWIYDNISWTQLQKGYKPSELMNTVIYPLIGLSRTVYPG